MDNNVEKIIKRMENLINEDDSFGAYEEYTYMLDLAFKEGVEEEKRKISKKMMEASLDINLISLITGLSKKEIYKL
ncbi:MAG: hypothetical protein IJZ36_01945 [Bacilli bacterium]|nr:hypothetical protein [Bacilli bacterium]